MDPRRQQHITFFVTTRCNLICKYCYANQKQKHVNETIDINFAKKGIDDFFDSNTSRRIRFFGAGEPTLEINIMSDIINYARNKSDNVVVELQTNGFFSNKVAEWIASNVDIIWISCDGPPDIQDYQRRSRENISSSPIVEKNISYILRDKKIEGGIRATITNFSITRQNEIIDYFINLGVNALWVYPIFAPVYVERVQRDINLMIFAEEFLRAKLYANKRGFFFESELTSNFDEQSEYHCSACLPCPNLTTDGYVTACDMALFGDTPLKQLVYGVYNKKINKIDYDLDVIRKLRSRCAKNLTRCKDCEVLLNCSGYCMGEILNETGDMFGIKEELCEAIRYLARNLPLNKGIYPFDHP